MNNDVSILLMKWNPYEEIHGANLQKAKHSFNPSYEMESLRRRQKYQAKIHINGFQSFL